MQKLLVLLPLIAVGQAQPACCPSYLNCNDECDGGNPISISMCRKLCSASYMGCSMELCNQSAQAIQGEAIDFIPTSACDGICDEYLRCWHGCNDMNVAVCREYCDALFRRQQVLLLGCTSEMCQVPSDAPTEESTEEPTEEITTEPTDLPTDEPTADQKKEYTDRPTDEPTELFTQRPTELFSTECDTFCDDYLACLQDCSLSSWMTSCQDCADTLVASGCSDCPGEPTDICFGKCDPTSESCNSEGSCECAEGFYSATGFGSACTSIDDTVSCGSCLDQGCVYCNGVQDFLRTPSGCLCSETWTCFDFLSDQIRSKDHCVDALSAVTNSAMITGIAVGGALLVCIPLMAMIFVCCRRRPRERVVSLHQTYPTTEKIVGPAIPRKPDASPSTGYDEHLESEDDEDSWKDVSLHDEESDDEQVL